MWYLLLEILCPVIMSVIVCFLAKTQIGIEQFNPLSLHSLDTELPDELRENMWCYSEQEDDDLCEKLMSKLESKTITKYNSLEEFLNCTQNINMAKKLPEKLLDFNSMIGKIEDEFNFSFNEESFSEFLETTYKQKLTTECSAVPTSPISFGIYFNNTPDQINYTVYYNREMIEEYHENNFDKFESYFLMYRQESMSLYGFILQEAIEGLFTNKIVKLGALANNDKFSLNYSDNNYELSYVFPSAAAAIVFEIIVSNVRGEFYRMLRKFGEAFWKFWLIMYGFGLFVLTLTIFLQMVVAKGFGVDPFLTYSVGASLLFAFLSAIPSTAVCCLIGICIESEMMEMIIAVGFSVGFTLFPMLIEVTDSGETKEYSSLWDKSWCPEWIVWFGIIIFPPFTYYSIGDHWASTKFLILDKEIGSKYTIAELFNSQLFNTSVTSSKVGGEDFNIPPTGNIVIVIVVEFLVYAALGIYLANIIPQSDYVGMPFLFFIDKQYWELRKRIKQHVNPGSLNIENVIKSYLEMECFKPKRRNVVLDKINLEIEPGTVVGLMGLTGSGKTTLCRILERHTRIDSGIAIYNGIELTGKYASLYHNLVTSCPQDKSNIMFNASIKDNIRVCKAYVDWNCSAISLDEYIVLMLKRLKLEKHQDKTYYELSGGMQRRLSLLISLMRPTHIYLADEVTANVDPELKHDIWTTLEEYEKLFKRIIIMTSHDSYELQYICGQIVHLDNKEILLNVNTNEFMKEHVPNTNKLQINQIIYQDVLESVSQSESCVTMKTETSENDETENLLAKHPKEHKINTVLFAFRKRWYWFLNTWMATPVSMVILALILSSVFVYMTKFSSTANLNIKDNDDLTGEQLFYLPKVLQKYNITSENGFENALLNDSMHIKYISQHSGTEITFQTLKDSFLMDQIYGIEMTFGTGSRLLGLEERPEQEYLYLVDEENELSNLTPEEEHEKYTEETINCTKCEYFVSSVNCDCDTEVNETANVVCTKNSSTCEYAPTFYYFKSLNDAIKYREDHALTEEQEEEITLANNLSQPLGILVPYNNALYVNMPEIQLKYIYVRGNNEPQIVSSIYYGNTLVLPLEPEVNVKNRAFLTNYNNDAYTKLSAIYLSKPIIANFYQQAEFNDFEHTDYYTNSYGGELMFAYFLTLEVCLFILLTIVSFERDSEGVLRKQLEGLGVFEWKLIISQILVDALEILFYTTVIIGSMVMIDQAPQFRDFTIFIAVILEAVCHSIVLQLYMMIFEELPAIVLFLSILLTFQIFTTAFINVGMEYSIVLNLFLPGYYYVYIMKVIATALTYPWYWLFYGILVNLGELIIALLIVYYTGRKNTKLAKGSIQEYLIEAKGVSAGYGRNQILKDINMTLSRGESLALIGNNGCGKSTFLKICIHELKYKGYLSVVSDIAIIPQDDIIFHNITVEQYFKIVGAYDLKLLQELGLDDSVKEKYHQLSSGQQRRLTIALVLALHPGVVILDEITVGSDFIIKNRIWSHLNSCVDTKVVISHDMDEILKHSNRICFIKKGVGSMISSVDDAFLIVAYEQEPVLPNFEEFFDKEIIQVDHNGFTQVVKQLKDMNIVFTYEENSLEKLFVEEYKLETTINKEEKQE